MNNGTRWGLASTVGLLTTSVAMAVGGECAGTTGQGRSGPALFSFQTSDDNAGLQVFDNFGWPGGDVTSLRWWAVDVRFVPGLGFLECMDPLVDPARNYRLTIWGDLPGNPPAPDLASGAVVTRLDLEPDTTVVGYYPTPAAILEAYSFDLDLAATADTFTLTAGTYWLSLEDIDNNVCFHRWLSSPDGDGVAYFDEGVGDPPIVLNHDMSYCFNPTVGPGSIGACCFVDGTCSPETSSDCDAMIGTFEGALSNCAVTACPQVTQVLSQQKISALSGGFTGPIDGNDRFGSAVANIGDVNGDGVVDILVGAPDDSVLAIAHGAIWVVLLNPDGTVLDDVRIDDASPFGGSIQFGSAVCGLGDLDGDGVTEIAVGGALGIGSGVVWVFFLNEDGSVASSRYISSTSGDIVGLDSGDRLGRALANLGDLDGDGIPDLAVGAPGDDDGGSSHGAVWILFMDTDGTVKSEAKISETAGGFDGVLDDTDFFGSSLANIGDVNGDGVTDLAVGATLDDDGGSSNLGAVWILFLDTDGSVTASQKISATEGGFTGTLENNDLFGYDLAPLGDANGDGIPDLAAGSLRDGAGLNGDQGAVWTLFLDVDGTVRTHRKINTKEGGLEPLDPVDHFGSGVDLLGDMNGDGTADLVVGAHEDDDGGSNTGAVYILFLGGNQSLILDAQPPVPAAGVGELIAAGNLDPLASLPTLGPAGNETNDVVIALTTTDQIQVFSNNGGNWDNFTAQPPVGVGSEPTGLALGLLNDDPYLDIAVAHQGDDSVRILVNNGFATFAQTSFLLTSDPGDERRTIAAGDFDMDGDTDLAVASAGLDLIEIWLNASTEGTTPTFVPGPPLVLNRDTMPWSIDPDDVDGDRCLDLVVANAGNDTVSIFINDGSAVFTEIQIQLAFGAQPVDTAVGDFNLDGLIDVASANFGDGTISVSCGVIGIPNTGAQFVGIEPRSITAANLDGDPAGTLELAIVATHPLIGPSVFTLQNQGSPGSCVENFQFPIFTGQEDDPLFVIDVFLDDDNVPDLATTNTTAVALGGSVSGLLSVALTCQGDADGTGAVDVDDLLGIIVLWGSTTAPQADINNDGIVNVDDLVLVVLNWGSCN